jgi:hypothetical protein
MDDHEALKPFFERYPKYAGRSVEDLAQSAAQDPELATALYEFSADMERIARDAYATMFDEPPPPRGLLSNFKKGF